jgi:hypothetical protein
MFPPRLRLAEAPSRAPPICAARVEALLLVTEPRHDLVVPAETRLATAPADRSFRTSAWYEHFLDVGDLLSDTKLTSGRFGRQHAHRVSPAMTGCHRLQLDPERTGSAGSARDGDERLGVRLDGNTCKSACFEVERAGLEPAASGLQSSPRPPGLSRDRPGLPARAGLSSVALRGSPAALGTFRRPHAGCGRDGSVVSFVNTPSVRDFRATVVLFMSRGRPDWQAWRFAEPGGRLFLGPGTQQRAGPVRIRYSRSPTCSRRLPATLSASGRSNSPHGGIRWGRLCVRRQRCSWPQPKIRARSPGPTG